MFCAFENEIVPTEATARVPASTPVIDQTFGSSAAPTIVFWPLPPFTVTDPWNNESRGRTAIASFPEPAFTVSAVIRSAALIVCVPASPRRTLIVPLRAMPSSSITTDSSTMVDS